MHPKASPMVTKNRTNRISWIWLLTRRASKRGRFSGMLATQVTNIACRNSMKLYHIVRDGLPALAARPMAKTTRIAVSTTISARRTGRVGTMYSFFMMCSQRSDDGVA